MKALILSSRSQTRRRATVWTRPALRAPRTRRHRRLLTSKPTRRSMTRRVCCASTRCMSMSRGFAMAAATAERVISLYETRRTVFAAYAFAPRGSRSTSSRCQAMASPSRSGSLARRIVSAFFAAATSSPTTRFLSSGTTYLGVNDERSSEMSMPSPCSGRSRMWPTEARTL